MNIAAKPFKQADFSLLEQLDNEHIKMAIQSNLMMIQALNQQIEVLEDTVLRRLEPEPAFQ